MQKNGQVPPPQFAHWQVIRPYPGGYRQKFSSPSSSIEIRSAHATAIQSSREAESEMNPGRNRAPQTENSTLVTYSTSTSANLFQPVPPRGAERETKTARKVDQWRRADRSINPIIQKSTNPFIPPLRTPRSALKCHSGIRHLPAFSA